MCIVVIKVGELLKLGVLTIDFDCGLHVQGSVILDGDTGSIILDGKPAWRSRPAVRRSGMLVTGSRIRVPWGLTAPAHLERRTIGMMSNVFGIGAK
jgi:hypothetical protein